MERLRYQKQHEKYYRVRTVRLGRAPDDETGVCVWTTEEQPGLPGISASRHKKVTLEAI
ncbi:hypothetical protein MHI45_08625 [Paenibacillus sp. FSL H3-0321]|uniref:hypothetical protein n=1 Tax=unclassified Paenibacillus TaxID=185978 RepID=UPI0015C357FE|nr:hypothetical protein [Paenibacillus borealis]